MTNLTKTEKLLREGNEKWKKFLKEGAFVQEGGTMGEYGKMDAEQGLPPTKVGRGNEEYMAAYNAVLQARGEEPLDTQQPDQAYLDALHGGQLEEQEKEADPRVVAMQQAMDLLDDLQFDSLESALDNMNTEVVRKLSIMLKQLDYNRNQVGNLEDEELEEGFLDWAKKKTGLGTSDASRKGLQSLGFARGEWFELKQKFLPTEKEINYFIEFIQNNATRRAGGMDRDVFDTAWSKIRDSARQTLSSPTTFLSAKSKIEKKLDAAFYEAEKAGKGDKTFPKVRAAYNAIVKDMDDKGDYIKDLQKAFKQAQATGKTQALEDIYNQERADAAALRARTSIFDKIAKQKDAAAKNKFTSKKNPDDEMQFSGGQMSSKSRFAEAKLREAVKQAVIKTLTEKKKLILENEGMKLYDLDEKLSPEDRAHYDSVMNKGKVANLKGDMGPIPGLEGPFQFRSGAVLYYDPKAGKYYDRGKDMYLDNDEASALTMEAFNPDSKGYLAARDLISDLRSGLFRTLSDEELQDFATEIVKALGDSAMTEENRYGEEDIDQIESIANDIVQKGGALMQVATALKDAGFDATLSSGALMITTESGDFFIGKEDKFDISPDEEVRQVGPYVLGTMG